MKRFVWLLIVILLCVSAFSACASKLPFNARFYGEPIVNRACLKDDFYKVNLTKGASLYPEEGFAGNDYPETKTVIVDSKERFNEDFKDFPLEVDFSKSIILMYGFTTSSGGTYVIKDILLEGKTLTVYFAGIDVKKSSPNATVPMTKWIFVLMDKTEFETVVFK